MPLNIKSKLLVLFFILSTAVVYNYVTFKRNNFDYFSYLCRIYDREGFLIEKLHKYVMCDYRSDGKNIATNPFTGVLVLSDFNDNVIWISREYAHHDLKFTADEKNILVITSEIIKYQNLSVRSDCFSKRDLNNKKLAEWCVKDNILELEKMGFQFKPKEFFNTFTSEKVNYEISHANSIYEIPENSLSRANPALAAGNYIINLYGPSKAVLILSADMKKILWSLDMTRFKFQHNLYYVFSHDWQVLANGHVLAFLNFMQPITETDETYFYSLFSPNLGVLYDYQFNNSSILYSTLVEIDPLTHEVVWYYQDKPASNFYEFRSGTVSKFKDSVVYTNFVKGGEMIEIDNYSNKIWQYSARETNPMNGNSRALVFARPLLNKQYLKEKDLIDNSLFANLFVQLGLENFCFFCR